MEPPAPSSASSPPENATGNYVKVVQRIPVRIDFTDLQKENGDYALRPGYSVIPEIEVKGDVPPCSTNTNTQPGAGSVAVTPFE